MKKLLLSALLSCLAFALNAQCVTNIGTPNDIVICQQTSDTMGITGDGVTGYQWQASINHGAFTNIADDATYSGTQTRLLTINLNNNMNGDRYRCVLSSACPVADTTNYSGIAAYSPSAITAHPQSVAVCENQNGTTYLSCNASGPKRAFVWQVDKGNGFQTIPENEPYYGSPHAGNMLPILQPPASFNGYAYRCGIVELCYDTVFTNGAYLTVNSLNIPITTQPKATTAILTTNTSLSVKHSGTNVTYQWEVNKGSGYTVVSNNSTYSGATEDVLEISNVSNTLNGYIYRCKLNNACAGTVTSSTAVLSVIDFKICMVTADAISGKNQVIFEKPSNTTNIDSFLIHREGNITNQFDQAGHLALGDLSVFTDNNSFPTQQAYNYRMSIKYKNGVVTAMTGAHKTIHLTINKGINDNTWNLIWTPYSGVSVATYNIYRGTDSTAMSLLTSISGSFTSYTDNAAPTGSIYYQLEIQATTCTPSAPPALKMEQTLGGGYTSIKSNFAFNAGLITGIHSNSLNEVTLYPNPNNGTFTLQINSDKNILATLKVENILGETIYNEQKAIYGNQQIPMDLKGFSGGIYFVKIQCGIQQEAIRVVLKD